MPLKTERLLLRAWRDDDRSPFAAINADPEVMRHFPATLTREQSDALFERASTRLDSQGWGLWAVEVPGVEAFIGFIGLAPVPFVTRFTPAVEVGWRLAREHWGRGYAPEGAAAALDLAFDSEAAGGLGLKEVVSFTTVANTNSRRVMEKLGLVHDPGEDFDHPNVAADSPVRRHVLYRIRARAWRRRSWPPRTA